ncbi:MAG: transglycosylase domain-containing protein [Herpetosiphonaceae bacterium]|nr:transglycosylase domain-containing protein [Herpetosiphonaceae bacterium]
MASQPSNGRQPGPALRPTRGRSARVAPRLLRKLGGRGVPVQRNGLRLFLILAGLFCLFVPTVALGAGAVYYTNTAQLLSTRLDKLKTYRPFQPSRLYDRTGQLLYEFVYQGRRDPVSLNQISPLLRNATISIENKTFYEDPGVDFVGIAKAAYRTILKQEASGASTITQQLIKLVILEDEERSQDKVAQRKLTEIILAQQLTKQYSKDQILELYLNEINYGNQSYGIQAAAQGYFHKNASALTLNEASLLAGLPQSPTTYNPIQYVNAQYVLPSVTLPPRVWLNDNYTLPYGTLAPRLRQVAVLRQMVLNGAVTKVSEEQARRAVAQDLQFVRQQAPLKAPHFVFYVKQQLEDDPVLNKLLSTEGGLRITTTLDLRVQTIAEEEAARRIKELNDAKRNIHNAAVVALQPGTGQLLAMVGSIDYNGSVTTTTPGEHGNVLDGNVNVTVAQRQPGSALKPFTYLSALEQGKLNAGSVLWDVETRFPIKLGATDKNIDSKDFWYGPKNFDQRWHGPIRMRDALANSLNMPAVLALKAAGVGPTIDLLHAAGIGPKSLGESPDHYGLALTLGGGEVTPLDLTTAYNTLANGGMYIPTTPILHITDRDGKELAFSGLPQPKRVVDEKYVAIIRDFMGDNDARIPLFGKDNALHLSRPSHAKTGTTEDFRDAWALGYTPYVTVGVWTGNNNNEKTAEVESVTGGGVIWNRIMERLFADPALDKLLRGPNLEKSLDFLQPSEVGDVKRDICPLGGRFGQRDNEWFVLGDNGQVTTGKNDCDLYKTIKAVRDPNGGFCLPLKGIDYGDRLVTYKVWNLPSSQDDAKIISGKYDGGQAKVAAGIAPTDACSADVASAPYRPTSSSFGTPPYSGTSDQSGLFQPTPVPPRSVGQGNGANPPTNPRPVVQPTTPPVVQPVAPPTAPPAPRGPQMPGLVGFGENQAKAKLAALGVPNIVVDYQGRDRLGPIYDKFPAYAVVSTSPGPGAPLDPGTTVVLGVRAP